MKKGKLIVIDGNDGSGKATQVRLLAKRLQKEGKKVKVIDFPRYYNNDFGKLIRECLDGKHGKFIELDPYIISTLYAADRWESSTQIRKWIQEGNIVLVDRYASANQIHQGGKIKNQKERAKLLKWIEKIEFQVFKIPQPDAVLILDVPVKITQKLLNHKGVAKDLAERNMQHLKNSKISMDALIKGHKKWIKIDCVKNDKLMNPKEISKIIWKRAERFLK